MQNIGEQHYSQPMGYSNVQNSPFPNMQQNIQTNPFSTVQPNLQAAYPPPPMQPVINQNNPPSMNYYTQPPPPIPSQPPSIPPIQTLSTPPPMSNNLNTSGFQGYTKYPTAMMEPDAPSPSLAKLQMSDAVLEQKIKDCDTMSASNYFVRTSIRRLPSSASMKQKLPIPVFVSIQPLATLPANSPPVPVKSFEAHENVIRCKQCRTYMNPFVNWVERGTKWICNMCSFSNETPAYYHSNINELGYREDYLQRVELSSGSVEYIAPSEYMVRAPQPPVYIFVIDSSSTSVKSGYFDTVLDSIINCANSNLLSGNEVGHQRAKIGIITFDSTIHFYSLNSKQQQPQMLVVSDLTDIFLPTPGDLVVDVIDSHQQIISTISVLKNLYKDSSINESCLGSAIKAAHLMMRHLGGKMLVFASTPPTIGDLTVKLNRENPALLGTDKEGELLKPENESFKLFAEELTRVHISLELFAAPVSYFDLASYSPMVKCTSGDIHYYPGFTIDTYGEKLMHEVNRVLTRESGWEAVMRVRVSKGWNVVNFFGHLFVRGHDLLVIPNCNSDQNFAVQLDIDTAFTIEPFFYAQVTLLYTSSNSERRIRVHTIGIPVTQNIQQIAESIDLSAVAALISYNAMEIVLKSGKIADSHNYLMTVAQQAIQQLPGEVGKILALYVLGAMKSAAFRAGRDVRPDLRVYLWSRLEALSVDMVAASFYPRMYALHDVQEPMGDVDESTGSVILPQQLSLTKNSMTAAGAYLIEDGESILLWIGSEIDPHWLAAVFGVASFSLINEAASEMIGRTGNSLSIRVSNIISELRNQRVPPYMKLWLIKQGDPIEGRFFEKLVEDSTPAVPDTYTAFIQRLSRQM